MKVILFTSYFVVASYLTCIGLARAQHATKANSHASLLGAPPALSEELTAEEAFVNTLVNAALPGGFVSKSVCNTEAAKRSFSTADLPLVEALNLITRLDPGYRWHFEQGVVNLIPVTGEPELLRTRIREYRVDEVANARFAINQLLNLLEVRQAASRLKLKEGIDFGGLSSSRDLKLSVHCQNVTVREALNAITRAHGRAIWRYSEWHCNGEIQFAVNLRVG